MSTVPFVTCDLLDDHPEKKLQVVTPLMDGKFFKSYGARKSFGGQVVTVKCFEDNSRVKELLATEGTGKVLVVDGGASMRCALMGDLIAESAVKNHWNGVVIYGCIRDVDAIATLDLGVHALAAIPQKSNRKGAGETDIQLSFGGVNIKSGDYIYADNNGIVIANEQLANC
ncbi:ribonuclease E activity regulator RraA [Acinetobacter celticus]|uniref:4-hydroxy-4-methyl-2-oxoglutarate aldolase n=1 Tax=Acinetobacter celticus TaxID=1891224 RepID=A0A1C3CTD1_9GAMM|nr:ribonuclease E activity regulator RraA [Acinetobacter celticus]ODA11993.1 ribonuclease activity regulator protein RraA [Acinetobacter celticus]